MLLFLLICFTTLFADDPPREIPPEMWNDFTSNGKTPVSYWYLNNSSKAPKTVSHEILDLFCQKAKAREWSYNGELDGFIFEALDSMKQELKGKKVCIMGSFIAWYEGILLSYNAQPFVISCRPIETTDPRVVYMTKEQFKANPRTFDLVLSISSTDHAGLGRDGEPLDPSGDLKEMSFFKKILNPGGKLLLSVSVGPDALVWNAHRVYGWKRLKLLLNGWKPIKYYGFKRENLTSEPGYNYQPVLLLTPR